jgi:histidinol-phosphate aminotransferase
LSLKPKPEIEKIKIPLHGGINYAEIQAMGLSSEEVLDFSVCSNPFIPPPGIKKILNSIAIEQYPDPEAAEFRERLSAKLRVSPDNILAGSGIVELIRLIALTYLSSEDPVLIPEPTFSEYEVACQIIGAKIIKPRMKAEDNFALKAEEMVDLIKQHCPKAIFICNPNNPTGKYLSQQEIEMILGARENILLILDEAYIAFLNRSWSSLDLIHRGNVIILRSMTKDYALAGLRLGYAIANQEIIASLCRVRPPWNVNIVAQKVGVVALEEESHLKKSLKKIMQAKQFLLDELTQLGFHPLPSETHFFLVRVGSAREFRTALLKEGILVRDCTSFGLPEYVRIAPRSLPECQRLIAAIKKLKHKGEI